MNWYCIENKSYDREVEYTLYGFRSKRQIRLPAIRDTGGRYRTVHVPIPKEIKKYWMVVDKSEKFQEAVSELCTLLPQYAGLIQSLPPASEMGHLLASRICPACPEIMKAGPWFIVRESLRRQLQTIPEIEFFLAYLEKAVPLEWQLGQPVPQGFSYRCVETGEHSPDLAAAMGDFYEVILPRRTWYETKYAPPGSRCVKFRGWMPHKHHQITGEGYGLVTLAFEPDKCPPWTRLESTNDDQIKHYDFVREDVYEILREPSKWTFEFHPVGLC